MKSHLLQRTSATALVLIFALLASTTHAQTASMQAHFIDLGQADSALLEFPCGAILIDTGAETGKESRLTDYLEAFFQGRPDLDRTLESVVITHNHIDHTRALREVVEAFTVKRYIDNGQTEGIGTGEPNWVRANATTGGRSIKLRQIADADIVAVTSKTGLTDTDIDPVNCTGTDPQIVILSGRLDADPGWDGDEFRNKNNHSLVIRVDFGDASFLFTGDLEEPAIETLVDYYQDTSMLDVDLYEVGHHGSYNGTTQSLVDAMTPALAVFSFSPWDEGHDVTQCWCAWQYGHPRRPAVEMLHRAVAGRRATAKTVKVADGVKQFSNFKVKKKLYATGWDGTVKVRAEADGTFRVTTGG